MNPPPPSTGYNTPLLWDANLLDITNFITQMSPITNVPNPQKYQTNPLTPLITHQDLLVRLTATLNSTTTTLDPFCLKPDPAQEVSTPGGVVARFTTKHWLNAIAMVPGGVSNATLAEQKQALDALSGGKKKKKGVAVALSPVPIDANNYPFLQRLAKLIFQFATARLSSDQSKAMPARIKNYFCPHTTDDELDKYKLKIKQTSEGKGTGSSAKAASYEPDFEKNQMVVDNSVNVNDEVNWEVCSHCQERAADRFFRALNDETRSLVYKTILMNKKNVLIFGRNVYNDIKKWSLENFPKFAQHQPAWFSKELVTYISDDMIPDSCSVYKAPSRDRNFTRSEIVTDTKNGDVVCQDCGNVFKERIIHEGAAYRVFADKDDPTHHGTAANPLFSDQYNMATKLLTDGGEASHGRSWRGGLGGNSLEDIMRNVDVHVNNKIDTYGKKVQKTTTRYKDKQKLTFFQHMSSCAEALNMAESVLYQAKLYFKLFREDREAVQSWDVCQASCLLLAYEEKLKMGGGSSVVRNSNSTEIQTNNALDDDDDGGGDFDGIVNSRLAWRNRMHTINDDEVGVATGSLRFADGSNEMEKKVEKISKALHSLTPLVNWDIDDFWSWLIAQCKRLATFWYNCPLEMKEKYGEMLSGSAEEIEGRLVEKAFAARAEIAEEHEVEKERPKEGASGRPQLENKLNWQNIDKGRVTGGKKTVGMIWMLKTERQVVKMFGGGDGGESEQERDMVGKAFHRAVTSLRNVEKQQKRKLEGAENAAKRHEQLELKPWVKGDKKGGIGRA